MKDSERNGKMDLHPPPLPLPSKGPIKAETGLCSYHPVEQALLDEISEILTAAAPKVRMDKGYRPKHACVELTASDGTALIVIRKQDFRPGTIE